MRTLELGASCTTTATTRTIACSAGSAGVERRNRLWSCSMIDLREKMKKTEAQKNYATNIFEFRGRTVTNILMTADGLSVRLIFTGDLYIELPGPLAIEGEENDEDEAEVFKGISFAALSNVQ
jgi:hypothetical protein